MTAHRLLQRLDDLRLNLRVEDGRIRFRSRGGQPDDALRREMKQHRAELLDLLTRRQRLTWPPPRPVEAAGSERRLGPLTRAQAAVWTADRATDRGTYNLTGALDLTGALELGRLRAALRRLNPRHPSLRSVFPEVAGQPQQEVLAEAEPQVAYVDLSDHPDPLAECLDRCGREAAAKLPLVGQPPVRIVLYTLGPTRHVLLFVIHHIIADGLSLQLLIEDFAACYNQAGAAAAESTPGPLDMIDYAIWEREHLAVGEFGPARAFWTERLGGTTGSVPLPPPEESPDDRPAEPVTVTVDSATTSGIRALSVGLRSSEYAVVVAALSTVLSRYLGRDDFVIGMPVARRNREGLDTLVGLLLDMVPVRVDVGRCVSFEDLVRQTRAAILGAVATPLPTDVSARLTARSGIGGGFDVVFTDAGPTVAVPQLEGLRAAQLDVPQAGTKYGLNVLVRPDGDRLLLTAEFDPATLARGDVSDLLVMTRRLLAQAAVDPSRRLAGLAGAPANETATGAVGPAPARFPEPDESLISRLAEVVARRGDATALSYLDQSVSYRELADRVGRVAAGLRARGVVPGDTVAVSLPRGLDLVVAMLAVTTVGAAYLVLGEEWPDSRKQGVLDDADVRLVVGAETDGDRRIGFDRLSGTGTGTGLAETVTGDRVGYVIFTSGSTGRPKGVPVTHHAVLSLLDSTCPDFDFDESDVWTLFHSCAFDFSVWEIFGCLLNGGRLVVVPSWVTREPDAFAELVTRERVTVLNQTPSALSVMLPAFARRGATLDHLRYIIFGGEALERRLADSWYETIGTTTRLVNMYGITETTVHASWKWLDPAGHPAVESDIGRPLPDGALHVLDRHGVPVLRRCVGEIYVAGPRLALGYLGRSVETALRFVPDPFSDRPGARMYRSGDLARRNRDGLTYLGRNDAQVQIAGFRVELPEIEARLVADAGARAAAAVVLDDGAGPAIAAVVVPHEGVPLEPGQVLASVRSVLPNYMLPRRIVVAEALPLTPNGKLDRVAVAALVSRSEPDDSSPVTVDGGAESVMVDLFAEVLHEPAEATSNFFDLGGDSMRAIQMVELGRKRGLDLSVKQIYAAPTPRKLAADLWQAAPEPPAGVAADYRPFSLLPEGATAGLPRSVVDAYPMTALQTGMVYHREIASETGVYHIVLSYRVGGAMDTEAFRFAAQAVMDRHPALRTSFDLAHSAGPLQLVNRGIPVPVRFEDLTGLSDPEQEGRIAEVVEDEQATEFDIAEPGLLRLVVLTRSDHDYQLVFSHHHAILDGWSVNIFFADLLDRYLEARDAGIARLTREQDHTMAAYVQLERDAMADPHHKEFWAGAVAQHGSLVAADRAGTPVMRQSRRELPAGTLERLRRVARQAQVPVKSVLLAVHFRVMAWLTGEEDVTTGLVVAARPELPRADRALGLFLNELPVSARLRAQTWSELTREVHAAEQELLRHRWYPYALIQQAHGKRPLVDSTFNFTDFHTTKDLVRSGRLEVLDINEIEATHFAFGSNYTVDVRSGELRLILEYDAAALAEPVVELAMEAHTRALSAVLNDPDAGIRTVRLPSPAQLGAALAAARTTDAAAAVSPASPGRGETGSRPPATAGPAPAPGESVEQAVAQIWAEVLGPGEYRPDTDFFAAGGSSLTAMHVVSRLRARYGTLSVSDFMSRPTLAGVAQLLSAPVARSTPDTRAAPVVAEPRRYPLSPAQRQMWTLARRLPQLPMFGMPGALLAEGPLDLDLLRRALDLLVARHSALRTRFEAVGEEPVQVVLPAARPTWDVVDLSSAGDPVADCEKLLADAALEPIPLDRAPLMRTVIYRLAENRHVIHLNVHHIVCDGWSLNLLLKEAVEHYRNLAAGVTTPPTPAPAAAEIHAQRARWSQSAEANRQREYWVERLSPPWQPLSSPPGSRIGSAYRLGPLQRFRAASCRRRVSVPFRAALRSAHITDFMVVATAYAMTLRSWSGLDDIRIATMLADRAQPGVAETVGLLANSAVLRLDLADPGPLPEVVAQVKEVCLNAYDNQEIPFEAVLETLSDRHPAQDAPVFETMLIMQEAAPAVELGQGLRLSPYSVESRAFATTIAPTTAEFVLAVTVDGDEYLLDLQYKPAATAPEAAVGLLEDIATTIRDVGAQIGGPW